MKWTRLSLHLATRALRHPATGAALLRVAWRFRRRHWWQKKPFLPIPDTTYFCLWLCVAEGCGGSTPLAEDVERYARWAVRDP
ncbi:hypothetical protein BH11GEM2_BH11GEM2_36010 [soil metagenome]